MTEVFRYQLGGKEIFNRSHVVLSDDANHVKDAFLTIEHANITDSNVYNCTARNEATGFKNYVEAKTGTNVTVKSKYSNKYCQIGIECSLKVFYSYLFRQCIFNQCHSKFAPCEHGFYSICSLCILSLVFFSIM